MKAFKKINNEPSIKITKKNKKLCNKLEEAQEMLEHLSALLKEEKDEVDERTRQQHKISAVRS